MNTCSTCGSGVGFLHCEACSETHANDAHDEGVKEGRAAMLKKVAIWLFDRADIPDEALARFRVDFHDEG